MLFNSFEFAIFLPIVFLIYWFILNKNIKIQNLFIIIASYIFYGWWDWRFLSLIVISSSLDYFTAIYISATKNSIKKKVLLISSIFVNLGLLMSFKYFNFFIDSFQDAFSFFGYTIRISSLNVILPVGVSFYTFQTMSYTIDVYRGKMDSTKDFTAFFAYVSFFPQLVAGPIERAKNFLPQFKNKRVFNYSDSVDGMRQILWGLFKKMVIADNCARYVEEIFTGYENASSVTLILGVVYFAFQIYGDFSGYSDIAIGTARLFGFKLMRNFAYPYFSRDIAEFWRRWHISLSSWFRDYVYIPLGGSKVSMLKQIRNIFIVFIVSGFWHGANWTFIIWGLINALLFLPLLIFRKNRTNLDIIAQNKIFPNFKEIIQLISTFIFTLFAWIFFRANNVNHAIDYFINIFKNDFFTGQFPGAMTVMPFIFIMIIIEWINRKKQHGLELEISIPVLRWSIYLILLITIFIFGNTSKGISFIYFQF